MKRKYLMTIFFLNLTILFLIFTANSLFERIELEKINTQQVINQYENEVIVEYENKIAELESAYKEYEDKLYGVGGASSFPEELYSEEFVFPIAEEDFLRFTSPFGIRTDPFFGIRMHHRGVDIASVWRAQIVSVTSGTVVEHWPPPGSRQGRTTFRGHDVYGGMIKIDHGDFHSLYAHLSETYIRTGEKVSPGQVIGRIGNTGLSTGYHLHFEMIIDDKNINPLLYLSELDF